MSAGLKGQREFRSRRAFREAQGHPEPKAEGAASGSPFWVTALVLKTFTLFVVFGWLLKREYVDALPFVIGYAALPLGAVLGVLLPLRRQEPPPTG